MPLIYPKQGVFKWAATGAVTAMNGAKQTLGWVAELPTMQNMNWLFQQFSIWLQHINSRGISDWDNEIIYEPGALVMHSDNEVYRCILTTAAAIAPSNATYWVKYSTHISPDASTTVKGIAQVATTAEAQAWASDADMMTPLKLKESGQSANQSLAIPTGFQNEPWGFKQKWGRATVTSAGTGSANEVTITFATQFPTAVANIQLTIIQPSGAVSGAFVAYVKSPTASTFNIGIDQSAGTDAAYDVYWYAIGY
jgi:hypothetical protein